MKKTEKIANRINGTILIMFTVLLLLTIWLVIESSKKSVEEATGMKAISIATNIATYLNAEQYKELAADPKESELYWELREQLNELRELNNVLYVYTIQEPRGKEKSKFLVDGMPKDDNDNAAEIGTVSKIGSYGYLQKAEESGSYYTGIEESKYGKFVSGFIPLKDSNGEVYAYLGVDIDASHVTEVTSAAKKSILPLVVIVFIDEEINDC